MNWGDIGAVIATIATVSGAVYQVLSYHRPPGVSTVVETNNSAQHERRQQYIMLGLVVAAWGAVLFDYYTRSVETPDTLIAGWTGSPPVYGMLVDTKGLLKYKDSHKLMMIIRADFADIDQMTDQMIERSGLYTITGLSTPIAHQTSNILRFNALQPNNIKLYLTLIPNNSSIDGIKSLGDVERVGGKILTSRGQVIMGGPPDNSRQLSP
jgi:hypothetical protein